MKKGFTLVELISVIILLGVIGLIVFPTVSNSIRDNKEKLVQAQLEEIKLGAEKWAYTHTELLPSEEDKSITITLLELKKAGIIPLDIRNPKTEELLPNDMVITITFKNNKYVYFVDGNSGSEIINEYNENAPILILQGDSIEYIEYGSSYVEEGALAKDKDGNDVSIDIVYQYNGVEISNINTREFKTYIAIYSATASGYTSKIVRTIVIRDTTPPQLTIPENIELTASEVDSFNLLTGVTAIDNSGETISIQTSGYDRVPGKKIVTYTACDSRNNCVSKRRIVTIQ